MNGWYNYFDYTVKVREFSLTLHLKDGGFGDADGAINGVIVDISGVGLIECSPEDAACDGVADEIDEYPGCKNWIDVDEDGLPDECDPLIDSDRDTVADDIDLCPGFDDFVDTDNDGLIDWCDPFVDTDFDCVEDSIDKCPGFDDEFDKDGDGIPDACDEVFDPLNEPPYKPILSEPPFTESNQAPYELSTLTPTL